MTGFFRIFVAPILCYVKICIQQENKKNEGYSTLSIAFGICSVGLGMLGYGVRDVAYMSMGLSVLGILLGVLALTDKRQKKKYYAIAALILCPIGLALSLDAVIGTF